MRDCKESMLLVEQLSHIGAKVRAQDNRATHNPIFVVRSVERVYVDSDGDAHDWTYFSDDWDEATAVQSEELSRLESEEGIEEPDLKLDGHRWTRRYYITVERQHQAFFTEAGAEDYIRQNGHNLPGKPSIYVESGYRNDEWATLRAALLEADRIFNGAPDERGTTT